MAAVSKMQIGCPPEDELNNLHIFQNLCPPECKFKVSEIRSAQRRTKRFPCRWHVVYQYKDNNRQYTGRHSGKDLKKMLSKFKPGNATILDCFNQVGTIDNTGNGWVMEWAVKCHHIPILFHYDGDPYEEDLESFFRPALRI